MNLDKLVALKAEIAKLVAEEKAMLEEIKALGNGRYEDGAHAATVYSVEARLSPDPKAMEAKLRELGVDNRWFAKNQKETKGYTAVKISVL